MITHEQQDSASEVVGAVQPQCPPYDGLRRGRHVIEVATRPGSPGDQGGHARRNSGSLREPARQGIRELRARQLVIAETLPVRGDLACPDQRLIAVPQQVTGHRGQDALHRGPGQAAAL